MARTRQYCQFTVRALLLLSALVGVWLALRVNQAAHQRSALALVEKLGGTVSYHHEDEAAGQNVFGPGPQWLRTLIGDEYFDSVKAVALRDAEVDSGDLELLSGLPDLEELYLEKSTLNDTSLRYISQIDSLRVLRLSNTGITDAGLRYLRGHKGIADLWVEGTDISDASIPMLLDLPSLKTVMLIGTRVTEDGVLQLTRADTTSSVYALINPRFQVYDDNGVVIESVPPEGAITVRGSFRVPSGASANNQMLLVRLMGSRDDGGSITMKSGRPVVCSMENGDFAFELTLAADSLRKWGLPGIVDLRYRGIPLGKVRFPVKTTGSSDLHCGLRHQWTLKR